MPSVPRPRTISLPPKEMIKLGKEMVQWVKDNNPLHLSWWYTLEKGWTYAEFKNFKVCPEFYPYYEWCMTHIGRHYIDAASGRVKEGISQRFLRIYYKDLRDMEDETAKFTSDLKKEENKAYTAIDEEKHKSIMNAITDYQKVSAKESKRSKTDSKS